ncbi:MAG TPA: hypothetical protein ENJ08_02645 [Gammaproteobacteria bacterium]|nr:hypothetical protein [Gammaproteobacteria bacterium]
MRLLFIVIIALNLLYASWEYLSPVHRERVRAPLPADLNGLVLLHELSTEDDEVEAVETSLSESTEVERGDEIEGAGTEVVAGVSFEAESSATECFTLGPYKDRETMEQLKESLAERVIEVAVRKRQQLEKHRYWVFMPVLPDRKAAKAMAKKLRSKGIKDFYIVLSGKKKNSISLGHFREPDHANRRAKKVTGLGFDAEIDVIYREYDIYWLDYRIDKDISGDDFSIDEYITDGVTKLDRQC